MGHWHILGESNHYLTLERRAGQHIAGGQHIVTVYALDWRQDRTRARGQNNIIPMPLIILSTCACLL